MPVLGVYFEIWVFEWPSENLYRFLEKQVDSSDDKICWLMMLNELFKAGFRISGWLFSYSVGVFRRIRVAIYAVFFFQFVALCSPKSWLPLYLSSDLIFAIIVVLKFPVVDWTPEANFALRVLGVLCEVWVFELPSENLYLLGLEIDSSDDKICWLMMLNELFEADFWVPGWLFA